jgi:hypothetical protein
VGSQLQKLVDRRAQLVSHSELQRAKLSLHYSRLQGPIEATGMVFGVLNTLRHSPPLMITGTAIVLLKTPWRRLARIPKLAWRGWKMLQFVRSLGR